MDSTTQQTPRNGAPAPLPLAAGSAGLTVTLRLSLSERQMLVRALHTSAYNLWNAIHAWDESSRQKIAERAQKLERRAEEISAIPLDQLNIKVTERLPASGTDQPKGERR